MPWASSASPQKSIDGALRWFCTLPRGRIGACGESQSVACDASVPCLSRITRLSAGKRYFNASCAIRRQSSIETLRSESFTLAKREVATLMASTPRPTRIRAP